MQRFAQGHHARQIVQAVTGQQAAAGFGQAEGGLGGGDADVAAQGELRLSGAAPAQEAMLGAVRTLSEQPGWSRVMLTRITPPGSASALSAGNQALWSFDLSAIMQPIDLIDIYRVPLAQVQP